MTEFDQISPVVEGYAIMSGPIIPVELINIDQQRPLYSHSSKANMAMVKLKTLKASGFGWILSGMQT